MRRTTSASRPSGRAAVTATGSSAATCSSRPTSPTMGGPPAPSLRTPAPDSDEHVPGPAGNTLSDSTSSAHHVDVTGTVRPAGSLTATTVHVVQDMTNVADDAALDVSSSWTWDTSSTRLTGTSTTATSQSSTYQLLRTGATWHLVDNQDTTSSINGTTSTTRLRDTMSTAGPVLGVTGLVGGSQESWQYSTSDGACVDHELAAAVQNTVLDTVGSSCDGASVPGRCALSELTGGARPAAVAREVPRRRGSPRTARRRARRPPVPFGGEGAQKTPVSRLPSRHGIRRDRHRRRSHRHVGRIPAQL